MDINHSLILSAGLGTRMGEIGKILPKVLWPLFRHSLLEAQIFYVRQFFEREIYANIFHGKSAILDYCRKTSLDKKINFLFEPELLDVGGAVHNLASQKAIGHQGNLLVINGDQFLFHDWEILQNSVALLEDFPVVLMGIKVPAASSYNEILVNGDSLLTGIHKGPREGRNQDFLTYSGVSLINLDKLSPKRGKSPFFESVANFQIGKIKVVSLETYEYWDFGTLQRYKESLFSLLREAATLKNGTKNRAGAFLDFCLKHHLLDLHQVQESLFSYGPTDTEKTINLTAPFVSHQAQGEVVILKHDPSRENKIFAPGLYYQGLYSPWV